MKKKPWRKDEKKIHSIHCDQSNGLKLWEPMVEEEEEHDPSTKVIFD